MSNLTGNEYGLPTVRTEYGLTILQQFAAMAMQGLLSADSGDSWPNPEIYAKEAVKHAYALINELNKSANENI